MFEDAKFTLHKWHSNADELEENEAKVEDEDSFANSDNKVEETVAYLVLIGTKGKMRSA